MSTPEPTAVVTEMQFTRDELAALQKALMHRITTSPIWPDGDAQMLWSLHTAVSEAKLSLELAESRPPQA